MNDIGSPRVVAVCVSDTKGTVKKLVQEVSLRKNHGVINDAHADGGCRQVSLLAQESVDKLRYKIPGLEPGVFAENILTSGINLHELPIGAKLHICDAILEVTQIGKNCHNTGCAIKQQVGDCVMPREGIFAAVLKDGIVKPGDTIEVEKTDD